MWQISGTPVDIKRFQPFEIEKTLYYFDGPLSFTYRNAEGQPYFVHWCDLVNEPGKEVNRYLAVPSTDEIVQNLAECKVPIFDVLNQPIVLILDINNEGEVVEAREVEFTNIPRSFLPEPGLTLYRNNLLKNISTE